VRQLGGCLDGLAPRTRRVLVLRVGLGAARPHGRAAVANLLDLSVRRVTRIERRGIRTLRRLGRSTSCASAPSTGTAPTFASAGTTVAGPPTPGSLMAAATGRRDHRSAPGKASPSSPDTGGVLDESTDRTAPTAAAPISPIATPHGSDLTVIALALALAVALAAGLLAIRREFRT
jgi:hypothetical protein